MIPQWAGFAAFRIRLMVQIDSELLDSQLVSGRDGGIVCVPETQASLTRGLS